MKTRNLLKALPAVLALLLLVGCNNSPAIKDKDQTFVTMSDVKADTYQEVFDKLYKTQGVAVATDALLYKVAQSVLAASNNWTSEEIAAEVHERIVDRFDTYYSTSYKKNGLFDEQLVINSLTANGYKITSKGAAPYVETVDNLLGYDHLYDRLTFDYSEYEAKLTKDIYNDLLKEEYILSQRAASSSTYFKNKDVRVVQYFSWTPNNSNERIKWADTFQQAVDGAITTSTSFEDLVKRAGGLEEQWKLKLLKDLADDFAMINTRAFNGTAVNEDAEYPLPEAYSAAVIAYEKSADVVNHESKGYRDVYNLDTFNESQKAEVTSKLNNYSNNGANSIYDGYYQKQLEILTRSLFTEKVATADSASIINSKINTAIKDLKPLYAGSNYLDVTESGTVILKADSTNYIVYVTEITDNEAEKATADEKKAAKELAKVSSNVKNAIYYYLTELTSAGEFVVNNQDVYDYLNATYGYGDDN